MGKKKKQEKGKKHREKEEKLLKPDKKEKQAKPEGQSKPEKRSEPGKKRKAEKQPEPERKLKAEKQPESERKSKAEKQPEPEKELKPEETVIDSEVSPEVFRALGDENRMQILELLKDGEMCAGDLLKSVSIVQSTLSHHMKTLVEAGIVRCRKQGKWSYYSIDREMLKKISTYIMKWS